MDSGVAEAPIEDFEEYTRSLKARLNPTTSALTRVYEEAQKNPPDNRVLATQTFRVELDETSGGRKLSYVRRSEPGCQLEAGARESPRGSTSRWRSGRWISARPVRRSRLWARVRNSSCRSPGPVTW